MKAKVDLIPYEGEKKFSTLEESLLGKLIHNAEVKLNELFETSKKFETSKELDYAKEQLDTVKRYLVDVNTVLSYFSEGEGPGATILTNLPTLVRLYNANSSEAFSTPEFILFNVLKGEKEANLKDAIYHSLKQCGLKALNPTNIHSFTQPLKDKLKESTQACLVRLQNLLGNEKVNFDPFYDDLDDAIDKHFEFSELDNLSNLTKLSEDLAQSLALDLKLKLFKSQAPNQDVNYKENQFKIVHPISYEFVREALENMAIVSTYELNAIASFFNPETVDGYFLNTAISKATSKNYTYDKPSTLNNAEQTPPMHYRYKVKTIPPARVTVKEKNKEGKVVEKEIEHVGTEDMVKKYIDAIILIQKVFMRGIADYYNNYANTPHVQEELKEEAPKALFIQKFIQQENKLLEDCKASIDRAEKLFIVNSQAKAEKTDDFEMVEDSSKESKANSDPVIDFSSKASLDQIAGAFEIKLSGDDTLDKKEIMSKCLDRMAEIVANYEQLKSRKANYASTALNALISEDLQPEAQEAGFNIDLPLAKIVFTKTSEDQFKAVALSDDLAIDQQFEEQANKFAKKFQALTNQLASEKSKLLDEDIALHKKADIARSARLNELYKEASLQVELKIEKHSHSEKPSERIRS